MPIITITSNVTRQADVDSSQKLLESPAFSDTYEADSDSTATIPANATPYNIKPPHIDELEFVAVFADGELTLTLGTETLVGSHFLIAGQGVQTALTLTNNGAAVVEARVILAGTKTVP